MTKARPIDPDDEWPGRVGIVHPVVHYPGMVPGSVWIQFADGEGGRYPPGKFELVDESESCT